MEKLIELYEMASLNDAALRGRERQAIINARRALKLFVRAMDNFKTASAEAPAATESALVMAA